MQSAPARGCYDRGLSRQARAAAQQDRLVEWITEVYRTSGDDITVHAVTQAAGVGRNTFYEYFDDLDHALTYATHSATKRLQAQLVSELGELPTRLARLRTLSRVWFELVVEEPGAMALLTRSSRAHPDSAAVELFRSLLHESLESLEPARTNRSEPAWEACAAFAAEGASLYALRGGARPEDLSEALSVLLVRLFL